MKTASPEFRTALLRKLKQLYPDARTELNFTNPYELLIAVVLSAQCTDKKVNEVTPALFARFPGFASLARASLDELETIIRPINYFKTKARNLIALARGINSGYGGQIPEDHAELISLPGVGNKTANVVLGELGIQHTLPVDTHVFRLAHRLGLSKGKNPVEVERDLRAQFRPATWRLLHHALILHGRRVCKAQRPACAECALRDMCPFEKTIRVPSKNTRKAHLKL